MCVPAGLIVLGVYGNKPRGGSLEVRRQSGSSKGNRMKTWHKVAIGAGAVAVLGGIVLFSVNPGNKGVVTVQTAQVANQESLGSLVATSRQNKPPSHNKRSAPG